MQEAAGTAAQCSGDGGRGRREVLWPNPSLPALASRYSHILPRSSACSWGTWLGKALCAGGGGRRQPQPQPRPRLRLQLRLAPPFDPRAGPGARGAGGRSESGLRWRRTVIPGQHCQQHRPPPPHCCRVLPCSCLAALRRPFTPASGYSQLRPSPQPGRSSPALPLSRAGRGPGPGPGGSAVGQLRRVRLGRAGAPRTGAQRQPPGLLTGSVYTI